MEKLALIQSIMDIGIHVDKIAMGCTHQFHANSDWRKRLVVTIATSRKSLVLLLKSMTPDL